MPTLGFTHYQPAQLTTVGKRACLWLNDLLMDYNSLLFLKSNVKLRGVKGTTGTQASFMDLFNNDENKVKKLEKLVLKKLGYEKAYPVTGQTYPRKFDYNVLSVLSGIAQSGYRFANDIRLRSERLCSLARFVMSAPINTAFTASTQWFERTLDDSANKRIVIAQTFLAVDGLLKLYMNISENLVVYDKVIDKHIRAELPFMATENIIMEGVKKGGDRQDLHEEIRQLSMKASENVKINGGENNLIDLIKADPKFAAVKDDIADILEPKMYVGRAPSQVTEFIENEVDPILSENRKRLGLKSEINV